MTSIKVAHIADTHLCSAQYGFPGRGADFFKGFMNAITVAVNNGASVIIHAGDITNNNHPTSEIVNVQLRALDKYLRENHVCMLVISGNHDMATPHWCSGFDGNLEDGGIMVIDYTLVELPCGITIYGIPYIQSADKAREAMQEAPNADMLVWHGEVREMVGYASDNALSLEDFPKGKFKAVALGHIHNAEEITVENTRLAYSGSTEMCSSSESPDKKVRMWTFAKAAGTWKLEASTLEHVPTREVQRFTVEDELDLEKAVSELKDNALIYFSYAADVSNAMARLNALAPANSFIIRNRIPSKDLPTVDTLQTVTSTIVPADFVKDFISPSNPEYELAVDLMNPDNNHQELITLFAQKQLNGQIIV